ncbi:hypothetical protein AB0M48_28905 [Lentzea sp. NPDC051208]|uniref:hypothetical protein n=1 Tax=Lentzea sp. NPDC051208 TaxID=3154642 RepID=UPI003420A4F9
MPRRTAASVVSARRPRSLPNAVIDGQRRSSAISRISRSSRGRLQRTRLSGSPAACSTPVS